MQTVSVSRTLDASLDEVWAVLDDFGGVSKYNPGVEASSIVDGPETGTGATRECVFSDGGRIEEEIVAYEYESGYTVEFIDVGEMPLKRNVVGIAVDAVDGAGTVVTMTSTDTPKFGPLGWLLAKVVMNAKFRETFEDVLDGLESYVLSDQYVEDDDEAASD